MPPKKYVAKDSIQKKEDDNSLTAVIVADNYDHRFTPLTNGKGPWCLQKVCNVPIIDYTLDWIMRTDIKKIILLVLEKNVPFLNEVEERWRRVFDSFSIVVSKTAKSIVDAIKDLDTRSILQSDFLLLTNPAAFTNSTLQKQIEGFRTRRKENKNNVMTLIYAQAEHPQKAVIGVQHKTDKLVLYHTEKDPTKLDVDKPHFLMDMKVRRDVVDSGIAICSLNILAHFSGSFDFQQRGDVISNILVNEEVLLQNIHVDILDENEAAYQIIDFDSYLFVSSLLAERWLYPLCPDRMFVEGEYAFTARPKNIYVAVDQATAGKLVPSSLNVLGSSSVVGVGCKLEDGVLLENSTVGDNTVIGFALKQEATVESLATQLFNCIVGANCRIGKGCVLNNVVLGDGVVIADYSKIDEQTILSANFTYPCSGSERIPEGCAICLGEPEEDDKEAIHCDKSGDIYVWTLCEGGSMWSVSGRPHGARRQRTASQMIADGEDPTAASENEKDGIEMDVTAKFHGEVLDSMQRILTLADQQMPNLILEINSSKLAYNISQEDVAKYVFLSFLQLPTCQTIAEFKEQAKKWKKLFENYYEPEKSQIQMLMALEETFEFNASRIGPMIAKIVHFLYKDLDILEQDPILEWNDSLPAKSPIRAFMKPIVEWLESDSEGDSEDEDDSDELYKGYVDDPRNTDNAWMETVVMNFHDDKGILDKVNFEAGDDAV